MAIRTGQEIIRPYIKKSTGYIKSYIKSTYKTALWKESGAVPFTLSEKRGFCFSVDSSGQVIMGDNVSAVRIYESVGCGTGSTNRAWAYIKHNNIEIDNGLEYRNYAIIK